MLMDEHLKLNINLPAIKLELSGHPSKHIPELRKLFGELRKLTDVDMEGNVYDDMLATLNFPFWKLSKEVQKNEKVMNLLQKVAQIEEGALVRKVAIENLKEITDHGAVSRVNLTEIKQGVQELFTDLNSRQINYVFCHVMGNMSEESYGIVFDQLVRALPHAKFEFLKTSQDILDKTMVECMVFGNFPSQE